MCNRVYELPKITGCDVAFIDQPCFGCLKPLKVGDRPALLRSELQLTEGAHPWLIGHLNCVERCMRKA